MADVREQAFAMFSNSESGAVMRRETGWLIERYEKGPNGAPLWIRMVSGKPQWTEHAEAALRFAREEDAAVIARLWPEMCCLARITEHAWG